MDVRNYNRQAWDHQVESGNPWTIPVTPEIISAARQGEWSLLLTPTIPVPRHWYPPSLAGIEILCLASGGGQQGPVLAAIGAQVTVFDNSPRQLAQDRMVAEREGLTLVTIEGDMRDLSLFEDETFDLVFHPVSNIFVPEVLPVWREAYRVLRPGGALLAGFTNPVIYLFDSETLDRGKLVVRHKLPYSDLTSLTPGERQRFQEAGYPLEFGHLLGDQIGGQLEAGFVLTGFYEDTDPTSILQEYMPSFIATRAVKLPLNR